MQVPLRLLRAIRPSEHPGLLLATAYGTAVLSVSPFLLPAVAARYDLGLGVASIMTAGQLAGFVGGSWGAGRFLAPRGRIVGVALLVALLTNALSALLPTFALLVALRVVTGVALGVITWFSWAQVFGDDLRMSEIAVVGPIIGITTAPVAAFLIDQWGPRGIFVTLAVTALVPVAFSRGSGHDRPDLLARRSSDRSTRHKASPLARRVLVCLGLMTLGGSSVFTFGAVLATETTDLSLPAISLAYSANALAAIPSARWRGRRGSPGPWVAGCGAAAVIMGASSNGTAFVVAIAFWGFAFWMATPAAYSLLATVSHHPEERAGDAQAIMAAGRVVGPLIGGVVLQAGSPAVLGVFGGTIMTIAGVGLFVVDRSAASAVAGDPTPAGG